MEERRLDLGPWWEAVGHLSEKDLDWGIVKIRLRDGDWIVPLGLLRKQDAEHLRETNIGEKIAILNPGHEEAWRARRMSDED